MKKSFKGYLIIWVLLLAVFNAICFAVPHTAGRAGSFWVGYALITAAVLGQLICALFAFKADNLQKTFYRIPVVTACFGGTIASFIIGSLFMLVPVLPVWLGIIICLLILLFTAIAVVKAGTAADVVEAVDTKIKAKTAAIKNLVLDTQALVNRSAVPEIRAACNKVYEALRYSDPMSGDALADAESAIGAKVRELSNAVTAGDAEKVKKAAEEALLLIEERNAKCRVMK